MIVLSNSIFSFMGWDQGKRGRESKERFHSRSQHVFIYSNKTKPLYKRNGLSWYTNMAAVALFLNTKMAAMTWCENALYASHLQFTFLAVKAKNKLSYLLSKLVNTSHPDAFTSSWTVQSKNPFNTWLAPKIRTGKTTILISNCNRLHMLRYKMQHEFTT